MARAATAVAAGLLVMAVAATGPKHQRPPVRSMPLHTVHRPEPTSTTDATPDRVDVTCTGPGVAVHAVVVPGELPSDTLDCR